LGRSVTAELGGGLEVEDDESPAASEPAGNESAVAVAGDGEWDAVHAFRTGDGGAWRRPHSNHTALHGRAPWEGDGGLARLEAHVLRMEQNHEEAVPGAESGVREGTAGQLVSDRLRLLGSGRRPGLGSGDGDPIHKLGPGEVRGVAEEIAGEELETVLVWESIGLATPGDALEAAADGGEGEPLDFLEGGTALAEPALLFADVDTGDELAVGSGHTDGAEVVEDGMVDTGPWQVTGLRRLL